MIKITWHLLMIELQLLTNRLTERTQPRETGKCNPSMLWNLPTGIYHESPTSNSQDAVVTSDACLHE